MDLRHIHTDKMIFDHYRVRSSVETGRAPLAPLLKLGSTTTCAHIIHISKHRTSQLMQYSAIHWDALPTVKHAVTMVVEASMDPLIYILLGNTN